MRTIGLIGGMSWESSAEYYRILNEEVARRFGGPHSAQCLMFSVDFAEIEALQHQERWDEAAARMIEAAQRVERGGADCVLLCTEIMLLIGQADSPVPVFDTTTIHAQAAVDYALGPASTMPFPDKGNDSGSSKPAD